MPSSAPVFVFQPGGVPSGNIFDDWPTLLAAMALVDGPKTIAFDASIVGFIAASLLSASGDMTQVTWQGNGPLYGSGRHQVNLDGAIAQFPNLVSFGLDLYLNNTGVVVSPIVAALPGGSATVRINGTAIYSNTAIPTIIGGNLAVYLEGEAILGSGTNPAIAIDATAGPILFTLQGNCTTLGVGSNAVVTTASQTIVVSAEVQNAFDPDQSASAPGSLILYLGRGLSLPVMSGPITTTPTGPVIGGVIILDTTAAPIAVQLPKANRTNSGATVMIKNAIGANVVNVIPDGLETLDGSNVPIVLTALECLTLASNGGTDSNGAPLLGNWYVIGRYP